MDEIIYMLFGFHLTANSFLFWERKWLNAGIANQL